MSTLNFLFAMDVNLHRGPEDPRWRVGFTWMLQMEHTFTLFLIERKAAPPCESSAACG